jgi:tellurite resistance protein TerC
VSLPAELWVLIGFHVLLIAVLAIDLGLFQRRAHTVSLKEAAVRSACWVLLALGFALLIRNYWQIWEPDHPERGPAKSLEFVAGYLVEQSLSVDNLFVFLVIFRYFGVPEQFRHHILIWGIVGAVVLRAIFVLAGAAIVAVFHGIIYVFALFLLYTAYKLSRPVEDEIDPARNPVLRFAQRFLRLTEGYDSPRFFARHEGRWHATPMALVLLVIESTDVIFAVDSIPAVFGITRDPFIVYTSNICAVLGLRSLYFLVAGLLGLFRYLKFGLAGVLGLVGLKMLVEDPLPLLGWEGLRAYLGLGEFEWIVLSLGAITAIMFGAALASILAGPAEPLEEASPPEAELTRPERDSRKPVDGTAGP